MTLTQPLSRSEPHSTPVSRSEPHSTPVSHSEPHSTPVSHSELCPSLLDLDFPFSPLNSDDHLPCNSEDQHLEDNLDPPLDGANHKQLPTSGDNIRTLLAREGTSIQQLALMVKELGETQPFILEWILHLETMISLIPRPSPIFCSPPHLTLSLHSLPRAHSLELTPSTCPHI